MTTIDILRADKQKLSQVEDAIQSLMPDKRTKAVLLRKKFEELRNNLIDSIRSNERALELEREANVNNGILFIL